MTTTQTWGAPAGPQAARRHLYKAAPCPLLATVSHGGACETGAVSESLPSFWFFPALLCLSLTPDAAARHPNQHQDFILHYIDPILSPFYPKTLPPVPLWCSCARLSPTCMRAPPTQAWWRIARGQCARCSCTAKMSRKRRRGFRKSADCVGMVTQMMSRSQF